MKIQNIPPLNAALNGLATVLMTIGSFSFNARYAPRTSPGAPLIFARIAHAC